MTGSLWIVMAGNAVAAAILLFAASAKLVAPDVLGRSLLRLTGRPALAGRAPVRAIGLLELALALGLLVEPVRQPASALVLLLGLAFIAAGIAGRIRKVEEPCGCFGAQSRQPMGYQNIVLGLLVGLVGTANLATAQALSQHGRTAAPILAAALLCGICIVTGRSVLRAAPH
ncbi:MAG TPA: MauE/DoxX family redox-associated membrane protein [Jatrophihabitans sp.]|nr:MauE/DoxX family redox-associated membrane protein [Jatrophihabitans sp.]